ncbi:MAG: ABC transporter ATP-binding protein [Vicinamibacterales bacterium]
MFITFSYDATATRVMWEFNRIYRNLESALTDAAQFADLLLDPPVVIDVEQPVAFTPTRHSVTLSRVRFRYGDGQPLLFDGLSLQIPSGAKFGLVGRSGGGKTTLTRLLLRFSDIDEGRILIGGVPIGSVPQVALRRDDCVRAAGPVDVPPFHRGQHPRRAA